MRKSSLAIVLALTMPLMAANCERQSTDIIAQVQKTATAVCGYVPAASTVAAIVDAIGGAGSATVVATAANGICAAVKASGANKLVSEQPQFMGVPIHGHWAK